MRRSERLMTNCQDRAAKPTQDLIGLAVPPISSSAASGPRST